MAVDNSVGLGRCAPGLARVLLVLGFVVAGPCWSPSALAQSSEDKPLDGAGRQRFDEIERELTSGDPLRVNTALTRMGSETHEAYAELLRTLLLRGGNEPVLIGALELAASYAKPLLSASVGSYLQHRSERVRRAAAKALAETGGPDAVAALRLGLRSNDPVLREESARALGHTGDAAALADLFLALDRGIAAAAQSIGRLCDDTACLKLVDRLGTVPFEAMSEALAQILLRTDKRASSATRVEVVARVANLRTPQAAALLRGVKSKWPDKGDRTVYNALDRALDTFGGN